MSDSRPFVSLATDFGGAYSAICAGVVYSITPAATVLVLSDEITPYAIVEGALLLRQALPYLPRGVHVGIVDPGVGTPRHPVGIETGRGDVLIGPDNGVLVPAAEALGGIVRAHRLENPAYRLPAVSTSFHGRDIFAPAAAHIAGGVDLAELGQPAAPLLLDLPSPTVSAGALAVSVLHADQFGSLILSGDRADLTAAFGDLPYGTPLQVTWNGPDGAPRSALLPFEETFGKVAQGEPLLWIDSSGRLGLAVNQGSAAARFGLSETGTLTIRTI